MTKNYNFSPSSLNIFRECPRCFWLLVNRKIKRPRGPYPSIASGIDGVLKAYLDGYRKRGELPPYLRPSIKGKLLSYALKRALNFRDSREGLTFTGYLDECVVLEDNTHLPLDHKTRASFPKNIHPSYQFQMDCYTFLLAKNDFPTRNLAYLVYYAPAGIESLLTQGIKFATKVMEVTTSPQEAERVLYQALEVARGPLPPPGANCEYCGWLSQLRGVKEIPPGQLNLF